MLEYYEKSLRFHWRNMINLYVATLFSLLLHAILLGYVINDDSDQKLVQERPLKVKFKQVDVRKLGVKKAQDNNNLFGQLAYSKNDFKKVDQQVKSSRAAISKKKEKEVLELQKRGSIQRNQYIQKKISQESFKSANWSKQLDTIQDASVTFLPPKGISPDELNEFEKVFYAFYKRVATQYINSVQISVRDRINERPYVENSLRNASAQKLKAVVRYDELGNAEIVKILESSEDDDIHKIFENALGKMNKIPNIVKDLKDEDGKYYAIFSLSVNTRR